MGIRERLLRKIEDEIAVLERELRVDLPRQLAEAAAHGDLSENAEHEAAKQRKDTVEALLGRLHRKRSALSNMNTQMIPRDAIGFWSTVVVIDVDSGDEKTYKLVSPDESDPRSGLVSITSPVGRALAGRTIGDEVDVVTPRGGRTYEVLEFRTIHDEDDGVDH
jgi:transcription elongation factor GreA